MKQQNKIPKLRFPEFSEEWSEKYLGDTCIIKTGNKDTQNKVDDGQYPFYVRSNTVEKINSYSFDGEAILTSGDGVGVGKNFHYVNQKFDYHQRVYCLNSFYKEYFGKFIFYVFAEKFYKRVMRLSAKNSVDSVRMDMISKMEISFPKLPEQQKIASFLTAVDDKIEQLTKKKSLLEQYKKGVMQQIFSQQLRFKKEDGTNYPDWEEKKISEIFKVTRGQVLAATKVKNSSENDFKYPVYSSQTLNDGLMGYFNEYLFENSITWTTDGANAGVTKYRKGKFYCTNVCGVLLSGEGYANQMIAELLNTITKRHVSYVGNPKLMNNVMSGIKITIPKSIEEQTKIANFLSAIDDKIALVNTQLENTQQFKKGLLQQMFV